MAGERTLPGAGLKAYWTPGTGGWSGDQQMDGNLRTVSVALQLAVETYTAALPGAPVNGQIFIVPANDPDVANRKLIAVRDNGQWVYITPQIGWCAWVKADQKFIFYSNAATWIDEPVRPHALGVHSDVDLTTIPPVPGVSLKFDGAKWVPGYDAVGVYVEDEGGQVGVTYATRLNFVGAGVTVTDAGDGELTVSISGGGGGDPGPPSNITVADEGATISTALSLLEFNGAGVTATEVAPGYVRVDIPGGGGSGGAAAVSLGTYVAGKPLVSEKIIRYVVAEAVTFPMGLAGAQANAATAATADAVFSVHKNGSEFGTITIHPNGTFTAAAIFDAAFVPGDVLEVVAPAAVDSTLADISITLKGARN